MTIAPEGYPDLDTVISMYQESISRYGGPQSSPTEGCVEGALGNAVNSSTYICNDPEQPDPLTVAAFLFRSLAQNHCFADGNKRIAWLALTYTLHVCSELDIDEDKKTCEEFTKSVAKGDLGVEEIIDWLADGRLVPAAHVSGP